MAECRRCSECEGSEHHWLDNPDFGSDDPDADNRTDVEYVCKHCDAIGVECPDCLGEGSDWDEFDDEEDDPDEDSIADFEECEKCGGSGVLEWKAGEPRP